MKLKTILVDDEILNLKNLEVILTNNVPEIEILGMFQSVELAKLFIDKNKFDLLFLDIYMPVENGFDLLNYFPKRDFQVVFVTAHEDYAINAIRAGAIDYILKPILISELKIAIESVKKCFEMEQKIDVSTKIKLSYNGGKSIIDQEEIRYIHGDDNLSNVYLSRNRKVSVSKTLKSFEDLLENNFIRIHKSYLLNMKFASKIVTKEHHFIELENGTQLPISRRNFNKVKEFFSK